MKKIKCKVCRTRFAGSKEAKYLAAEKTAILSELTTPAKVFECFDCPKCGCQNAANVRMAAVKSNEDGGSDDGQ